MGDHYMGSVQSSGKERCTCTCLPMGALYGSIVLERCIQALTARKQASLQLACRARQMRPQPCTRRLSGQPRMLGRKTQPDPQSPRATVQG